ncbi:hypothetical protein CEE45_00840 [Candidatus Heimdallarchaeota archaeon B3_Heim]|nr:MAG: hypothetical protein CEE45_00840 [Candidatus Heimdallarchaeota archaeon B3_Heim]
MEMEANDLNGFLIYEIIANNGRLICSHCGNRVILNDLFDERIVIEVENGYIGHINCLLKYIMKAEPIISSGLANGLFSESQVRHDLLSKPFESVILDISRACSYRNLAISSQAGKCSKFIAAETNLIEMRNNNNLSVLLDYIEISIPDLSDSDIN